ncbi:hypothetical protein PHYC_00720 [Phycisphaerales bacterium]|nr:hypothetical protein PHYC_00720 [Phycisphaerales bacterium]
MSRIRGRPPAHHRGARVAAGLLAVGLLALAAWPGCTVTKTNYRTLSFFFDGVPDPDLPTGSIDPATGAVRAVASLSVHPPYAEEKCSECHKSRLRMSRNDSGLCANCHAGKSSEHQRMHGPVAAGACLWCHHPHESAQKHLLRDNDRAVCSQCHTPRLLNSVRVPEHADESRACLECHVGHGGDRPFLLRQDAATAQTPPATPEAP